MIKNKKLDFFTKTKYINLFFIYQSFPLSKLKRTGFVANNDIFLIKRYESLQYSIQFLRLIFYFKTLVQRWLWFIVLINHHLKYLKSAPPFDFTRFREVHTEKFNTTKAWHHRGSGCDTFGRVVTSNQRDPWFKSRHRLFFTAN